MKIKPATQIVQVEMTREELAAIAKLIEPLSYYKRLEIGVSEAQSQLLYQIYLDIATFLHMSI